MRANNREHRNATEHLNARAQIQMQGRKKTRHWTNIGFLADFFQ
jgi:hypothetical protein